jgi:hypothetical protein
MFSKTFVLAAAGAAFIGLGGSTGAFAQEATPAPEIDNFKPSLTRAEVVAQTRAAAEAGLIARNDADLQRIAAMSFQPYKSRAQVTAEAIEARRLGLVVHGELPLPQATPAQLESIRLAGERALMSQRLLALK